MARGTFSAALLVGLGALVGGAVGALLSSGGLTAPRGESGPIDAAAPERVHDLEERLVVLERKSAGRVRARNPAARDGAGAGSVSAANSAGETGAGASAPFWSSDTVDGEMGVTTEFVRAVREAIGTIKRENEEAAAVQGRENDRNRAMGEVDKRLRDYVERLGMTDAQAKAFRDAAASAWDRRKDAELGGASKDELAALDREKERAYREVLGSATHREFRRLEIDRTARPFIVNTANSAGVDKNQRDRIESLLAEHIDRYVDTDVRMRTEELDAETRASIRSDLNAANQAVWDRLRNEILTPEQRARVPLRLR